MLHMGVISKRHRSGEKHAIPASSCLSHSPVYRGDPPVIIIFFRLHGLWYLSGGSFLKMLYVPIFASFNRLNSSTVREKFNFDPPFSPGPAFYRIDGFVRVNDVTKPCRDRPHGPQEQPLCPGQSGRLSTAISS
jgi:hypothetical protein